MLQTHYDLPCLKSARMKLLLQIKKNAEILTLLRRECNMGPVQCFALFGYDSTALVPGAPNCSLTKKLSGEFLILPHINVAVKRSRNLKRTVVQPPRIKKKAPMLVTLLRPEKCPFAEDNGITSIACY